MKLLVNRCPHGFTISEAQRALFPQLAEDPNMKMSDVNRGHPALIESFEMGDNRGDGGSTLTIVEVPDNVNYVVVDRNGYETVYWTTGVLEQA